MMNWVWGLMMVCPLAFGMISGNGAATVEALLAGGAEAVALVLRMAGGFALWCGLIEILHQGGGMETLGRWMGPLLRRLFPGVKSREALSAMTMNLAANMLGLGNAATPMGLKAMRLLARENKGRETASRAMCMFLVINSGCVQLLPSTVLTLRAAAGSQQPGAVLLPTLVSTLVSAMVGITLCRIMGRRQTDE